MNFKARSSQEKKRARSLKAGFFVSVAIHGLILLALIRNESPELKPEPVPVVIELKEFARSSTAGFSRSQTKKAPKSRGSFSSSPKKKSYFGTSFDQLAEKINSNGTYAGGDSYLKDRKNDNPLAPWGQGSETFERIEDYSLFKFLFNKVDANLSYPGVLARHKIQGTVNARFVLNAEGSCDWSYTHISNGDPYLQLYVLDLLKRTCAENFKRYTKDRKITNVDMSFQFAISESGDEEYQKKNQILVGNTMTFYRNSHQSVLEWELGPFKGMFPVPAVYLNIPWIQENWERLTKGKEPLKEFKKRFG